MDNVSDGEGDEEKVETYKKAAELDHDKEQLMEVRPSTAVRKEGYVACISSSPPWMCAGDAASA